jgi:hypothetical protein
MFIPSFVKIGQPVQNLEYGYMNSTAPAVSFKDVKWAEKIFTGYLCRQ